jgi:hypothetical protein
MAESAGGQPAEYMRERALSMEETTSRHEKLRRL